MHLSKEALKPIQSDAARRELPSSTDLIENGFFYDELTSCDPFFIEKQAFLEFELCAHRWFSSEYHARPDGFLFYYARLQSREFLPLIIARDNSKNNLRTFSLRTSSCRKLGFRTIVSNILSLPLSVLTN